MQKILRRLLFVGLTTAVFVFFSEKAYWYPQGYPIVELLLFYAFPTYACLWVIDTFRVRRFAQLVLVAGLYAFLVEGVLTPVIFEAGLLDPIMPSYFIGWHGLLAVVFGWYWVRRLLVAGQWLSLLAWSAAFGLLWGLWSITYWLPEAAVDFPAGTDWTTADFGLHALLFTLMLLVAHLVLGQGGWQVTAVPSRLEKWVLLSGLLFFFATLSVPGAPLGILKLGVLSTAVFLPLAIHRRHAPEGSLLTDLAGTVRGLHLLPLLAMPLVGTAVYGFARWLQPTEEAVRLMLELLPLAQGAAGALLFGWAIFVNLFWRRQPVSVMYEAAG